MRVAILLIGLLFVFTGYGWLFFDDRVSWSFLSDLGNQNLLDYKGNETPIWWHVWRLARLGELLLLHLLVASLVFFKGLHRFKLGIGLAAAVLLPVRAFDLAQQIIFKSNSRFGGYEIVIIAVLTLLVFWIAFYSPTADTLKRIPITAHQHSLVINDQNAVGKLIKRLFRKQDNVLGYDELLSELKIMEAENLMMSGINKQLCTEQEYYYLLDNCAIAIEGSLIAFSKNNNQKELDKAYRAIRLMKETRQELLLLNSNTL